MTNTILGLGLVFTLKDEVSMAAKSMVSQFKQLDYVSTETATKMESHLKGIGAGFNLMGAGAAMLAPLGMAVSKSMEFNKAVSAVGAVSNASAENLAKLKTQAMQLGETTAFTAVQVAEGQKFLAMAGFDVNDTMSAMPGLLSLAAAGNLELGRAADIASNAMAVFGMKGSEAQKASDILAAAATSSNTTIESLGKSIKYFSGTIATYKIPMEEATAAIGLMGNAGLQGSVATAALSTAMTRFANPTKKMKEMMDSLGISAFDAQGKFVGLPNVIGQMTKASEKMTPQMEAQMLSTIFGAEAMKNGVSLMNATYKDSNGTILKGAAAMEAYQKALENSSGAAKRMSDAQLNNLAGSFTILQSSIEGLLINIGDKLEPIVKKVVDGITSFVGVLNEIAKSPVGDFLVGLTATVGVGLVAFGGLVSTFHAVKFAIAAVQPALVALKGFAVTTLAPFLPYIAVFAAIGLAVYGLVQAYNRFGEVLDGTAQPAKGFLGFMQKIGGVLHAVKEIWASATSEGFGMSEKLYKALENMGLAEFATNIGTWIVRIKAFFGGASERFDNLKNVFASVWEAFGRIGDAFSPILDLVARMGFGVDKLGGDVSFFATAGKVAFEIVAFAVRTVAVGIELLANGIVYVIDNVAIFANFFINTFTQIDGYIADFKSGMLTLPQLFSHIGYAIVANLMQAFQAQWASFQTLVANSIKALPMGEKIASYLGIGTGTDTQLQTQAFAGIGLTDASTAPLQGKSSIQEQMNKIQQAATLEKASLSQSAQALASLENAGLNQNTAAPAINVKPSDVVINMDGREIARVVQAERELDDARG